MKNTAYLTVRRRDFPRVGEGKDAVQRSSSTGSDPASPALREGSFTFYEAIKIIACQLFIMLGSIVSERRKKMAVIVPFKALRPAREHVGKVASCAYDVIDSDEARVLVKENPKSFLHVVKAEIDLPEHTDPYDQSVYEKARENLERLVREKVLFIEGTPSFYVYRQKMGNHVQHGIVACADISEYEAGRIKKHELTRAEKEADRTRHIDVVDAQTGPVFLTYRAVDSIDRLVADVVEGAPEYDFRADDGITHTVWIVSEEQAVRKIREAFSAIPSLYIADGHHRAASSQAVRTVRRSRNRNHRGDEEYNYMMAVLFPHDQLHVMAYNRVVKDLCGLTSSAFLERIAREFVVTDDPGRGVPAALHQYSMYLDSRWYRLSLKNEPPEGERIVESLDASILQNMMLSPVLGIEDVRRDERIRFVGGIRGTGELERLVDSGDWAVAFSLYPVTVEQLMSVADGGEIMPPKSTWFEPKLRSGIFTHLLY